MDEMSRLPKHTNPLPSKNSEIKPPIRINAIIIPEGATNGDMIMAMFKCMVIDISDGKVYVEGIFFPFDESWWNAPYRKVEE